MVGYSTSGADDNYAHAFVTSGSSMIDLGSLEGLSGGEPPAGPTASTLVDGGGSSDLSGGTGETDAFVDTYSGTYNRSTATYSGGSWSMLDIGNVLGGTGSSMAFAINSAGTVTGYAPSGAASDNAHAFVRTISGAAIDLGTLSGMNLSRGYAVNSKGDVAGYSSVSGQFDLRHSYSPPRPAATR